MKKTRELLKTLIKWNRDCGVGRPVSDFEVREVDLELNSFVRRLFWLRVVVTVLSLAFLAREILR